MTYVERKRTASEENIEEMHGVIRHQVATNSEYTFSYEFIDRQEHLEPLLIALDEVEEVMLDSQAAGMYHYKTNICLLQLNINRRIFIVDVLAPGIQLDLIWTRLARKHLIIHGSDFDLRLLHDTCEFRTYSLFDTVIAARLLGLKEVGLSSLVEEYFGVEFSKIGQKSDWSERPITAKLLHYAALDVWYLPALHNILMWQIVKLNLLDKLNLQCRKQIEAGAKGFPKLNENSWYIKGCNKLSDRGLNILHAVWHWRESWAQRTDTPSFKICSNSTLLNFANISDINTIKNIRFGRRRRQALPSLLDTIRLAYKQEPRASPYIMQGHQYDCEKFNQFRRCKLVYRPYKDNDINKIEISMTGLTKTLDLSLCGNIRKYLSVSIGFHSQREVDNIHKIEIWIIAKYLIRKNITHIKHILEEWTSPDTPFGLIWTWGNDKTIVHLDYLINNDISPRNIYENWKMTNEVISDRMREHGLSESWQAACCRAMSHISFELG